MLKDTLDNIADKYQIVGPVRQYLTELCLSTYNEVYGELLKNVVKDLGSVGSWLDRCDFAGIEHELLTTELWIFSAVFDLDRFQFDPQVRFDEHNSVCRLDNAKLVIDYASVTQTINPGDRVQVLAVVCEKTINKQPDIVHWSKCIAEYQDALLYNTSLSFTIPAEGGTVRKLNWTTLRNLFLTSSYDLLVVPYGDNIGLRVYSKSDIDLSNLSLIAVQPSEKVKLTKDYILEYLAPGVEILQDSLKQLSVYSGRDKLKPSGFSLPSSYKSSVLCARDSILSAVKESLVAKHPDIEFNFSSTLDTQLKIYYYTTGSDSGIEAKLTLTAADLLQQLLAGNPNSYLHFQKADVKHNTEIEITGLFAATESSASRSYKISKISDELKTIFINKFAPTSLLILSRNLKEKYELEYLTITTTELLESEVCSTDTKFKYNWL